MLSSIESLTRALEEANHAFEVNVQLVKASVKEALLDEEERNSPESAEAIEVANKCLNQLQTILAQAADTLNSLPRQEEFSEIVRKESRNGEGAIQEVRKFRIPDTSPDSIPSIYRSRAHELLLQLKEIKQGLDESNELIVANATCQDGSPLFREAKRV
jgi:hypothetical protein